MGVRIVILLCCAYAGWRTGSVQFGGLQEHEQVVQSSELPVRLGPKEGYEKTKAPDR
jgi:hypothetical protein